MKWWNHDIFPYLPLWQVWLPVAHSSSSLHSCLSSITLPVGHVHWKLPTVFVHSPPLHSPGIASHSSMSMHLPVWTFLRKPDWQSRREGHRVQGWPQATPGVSSGNISINNIYLLSLLRKVRVFPCPNLLKKWSKLSWPNLNQNLEFRHGVNSVSSSWNIYYFFEAKF